MSSFTLKLHGWGDTRRFVVVRELEREDKSAVGRRLIDVPGYTFRVWVTNRTEDAATLWRDYNGRATIEQRIEELKNDMHADGFCTAKFFATEAAMLSAIFALLRAASRRSPAAQAACSWLSRSARLNLLAVYQAQVTPQSGWRQPSTLRAAVFICGAVLGRIGRKIVLRLSQTGGGLAKHKALIDKACKPPGANRAAFASKASASPGLGHRDTRRLRDLTPAQPPSIKSQRRSSGSFS